MTPTPTQLRTISNRLHAQGVEVTQAQVLLILERFRNDYMVGTGRNDLSAADIAALAVHGDVKVLAEVKRRAGW